jgi:enoyl-CoA hydratase
MADGAGTFFTVEVGGDGVALVTMDRPPVNAITLDVYREFIRFADRVQASDDMRVIVLAARPENRTWCGGAEVREFVDLDYAGRIARFELLAEATGRIYQIDRPVIAAISGNVAGAGLTLAALSDIRIGAEGSVVVMPEIDRGLLGNPGLFRRLGMPEGVIREMLFTGRRFAAEDLRHSGLFNYLLPRAQVLPKALEIARLMAGKSLAALKAYKAAMNRSEAALRWQDTSKMTWEVSGRLTESAEAQQGVRAFLARGRTGRDG